MKFIGMKISLRKANTIQELVGEILQQPLESPTNLDVMAIDEWKDELRFARKTFLSEMATRAQLVSARYEVRKLISEENAKQGVTTLLATLAETDTMINLMKRNVVDRTVSDKYDVVEKKRERKIALLDKEGLHYNRSDTYDVSIIDAETIKTYKETVKVLKRKRQRITDELLEKNIRSEIELPRWAVDLLREHGLID
jgi:hypothetical protein